MTSSVVNDTRIEHEHRRRVDRPWKRNDETAITVDDDWREIGKGREPAGGKEQVHVKDVQRPSR